MMQRVQQAKTHSFAEAGPLDDVAQAQHLAGRLERVQNLRGVHQRLDDVRSEGVRGMAVFRRA